MLVSPAYYYNVPRGLISTCETLLQGVVCEWYRLATEIAGAISPGADHWFNDADYDIEHRAVRGKLRVTRLVLTDRSAGWWAVLDHAAPFGHDAGIVDFSVHAAQGHPPRKIDWRALDLACGLGKCAVHVQARRLSTTDTWYCPYHHIDLQHPLRFALEGAAGELRARKEG